jgi:hypothetical protein
MPLSPVSVTAAMAADKFHFIFSFRTPCTIQMNDGVHTVKTKIHILNFRKWDNCCILPNENINTVIITGIYGCDIERVLFQGISGRNGEISKIAVRTASRRG